MNGACIVHTFCDVVGPTNYDNFGFRNISEDEVVELIEVEVAGALVGVASLVVMKLFEADVLHHVQRLPPALSLVLRQLVLGDVAKVVNVNIQTLDHF